MSSTGALQTAPARTPAPTPAPASTAVDQPTSATGTPVLPLSSDIPSALARWQAVLMTALVIWALLMAALLWSSFEKTRSGAAHTGQLIRVHEIESNLFQADAIATNTFLVGGLEPPEHQALYDEALQQVSALIVQAADAQPADRVVLEALNHQVMRYAEQMQQARANNRQGLPVGAQYLREASAELRSETLPLLDNLITSNDERASGSLTGHQWFLIALPGIALLVLLAWFNQRLAAVFRRRINLGLGTAGLLVAAVTIGAVAVVVSVANDAGGLRDGAFERATSASIARAAGNDAKSHESLRLIARGSGAQFEEGWAQASQRVEEEIAGDGELEALWSDYTDTHLEVVAADEAGDWDGAVALATATEDGSSTAALRAFDERASAETGAASEVVAATLNAGSWRIVIAALVTILAAAAAMAAVSWGIAQRRREFT